MNDKIFGYDWETIKAVQQRKGTLNHKVDLSKPYVKPAPTDDDRALLAEHGADGLRAMGFMGVLDRLGLK